MELVRNLSPAEYLLRDPVFMGLVVALILGTVVWNLFHRHVPSNLFHRHAPPNMFHRHDMFHRHVGSGLRSAPPPMLVTVSSGGRKLPIQTAQAVRPQSLKLPGYENGNYASAQEIYGGRTSIPQRLRSGN